MMETHLIAAALGIAVLISATTLRAQDVNVEKNRSSLFELSDAKLRGDARREYRQFRRKADYFGAFFANPSEKVGGAYWNASNIESAERFARQSCAHKSKSASGCFLYAHIYPKRFDPSRAELTLSRSANKDFREYLRLQDDDRFGAFAISNNGASGYSWAEGSRGFAEQEAVKSCTKAIRKLARNMPNHLKDAVKNPDEQACRVIHWAR
ncbi:hypothetical protein [Pseudopelagicola sp. nBUS_19]|uniref:hypothetical protein n=1 Tax=Pseudopelagicola sp. nBUS_19 TaxID=3395316 RepID=UPI003EBDA11D